VIGDALFAILVGVFGAEALLRLIRLGLHRRVLHVARQAQRTIMSPRISDHWKERAVGSYATQMLTLTLQLTGALLVVSLLVVLLCVPYHLIGRDPMNVLATLTGTAAVTVVGCLYAWLRHLPWTTPPTASPTA